MQSIPVTDTQQSAEWENHIKSDRSRLQVLKEGLSNPNGSHQPPGFPAKILNFDPAVLRVDLPGVISAGRIES